MGTVPTGAMERELRKQYLQWLAGVSRHQDDLQAYVAQFEATSRRVIAKFGGQVASLGALADFPVPKLLELSPVANVVYDEMKQVAIQASIQAGLQATDTARQLLHAGLDKSFRRLNRLARTETVSAYWRNSWDSVADLPAIVMVWSAENGHRTCQYCLSRDGLVVEDANIRDHPQGRCTLVPTLRSQVKYRGTLQPDGSVDIDPGWAGQHVAGARAKVSAGTTTAAQRDPLSGKTNPAAPSVAQPAQAVTAPAKTPAAPIGHVIANANGQKYSKEGVRKFAAYESPASEDWRYISDRTDRMTGLLQYDKAGRRLTEKVASNLDDGLAPFTGIDLVEGKANILNSQYLKQWIDDMTAGQSSYSLDDLRSDLVAGADFLRSGHAAEEALGTQYRGVNLPKGTNVVEKYAVGQRGSLKYSSATPKESIASSYAGAASAGERVIFQIEDARGHKLTSVGRVADDPETILTGEYEITSIEPLGSGWKVTARWL